MADWTTLPNAAVGVGGLPSGTTVTALRDNPVAIAEGAPGAPRIYGDAAATFDEYAADNPLAAVGVTGDLFDVFNAFSGSFASISTTSSTFQSSGIITAQYITGTVRFSARQNSSASGRTNEMRFLKNGIVIDTWSVSGGSAETRTVDISVANGDTFEWQARSTAGGQVSTDSYATVANDALQTQPLWIKRSQIRT